jgi:hypothetical protein
LAALIAWFSVQCLLSVLEPFQHIIQIVP